MRTIFYHWSIIVNLTIDTRSATERFNGVVEGIGKGVVDTSIQEVAVYLHNLF